jgi:hypothetical protein
MAVEETRVCVRKEMVIVVGERRKNYFALLAVNDNR